METFDNAMIYESDSITPHSEHYCLWQIPFAEYSVVTSPRPESIQTRPKQPMIHSPAVEQLHAILSIVLRYKSSERRKQELEMLMFAFVKGFRDATVSAVESMLDWEDSMLAAQVIIALGGVAEDVAVNSRRRFFVQHLESTNPYIAEAAHIALEALEDFALSG